MNFISQVLGSFSLLTVVLTGASLMAYILTWLAVFSLLLKSNTVTQPRLIANFDWYIALFWGSYFLLVYGTYVWWKW